MSAMADKSKLFQNFVKVKISLSEKETRCTALRVSVHVETESTPVYRKLLSLVLTDPNDPYFLYSLSLAEEKYHGLKCEQGLLIDFSSFPEKLIELIQLCIEEEQNDEPKFILCLSAASQDNVDSRRCELVVVQVNQFKHLTHLILPLSPATSDQLQTYMVSCLQDSKKESKSWKEKYETEQMELTRRLTQTQEVLSVRTKELDDVKCENEVKLKQLKDEHETEMRQQRDKMEQLRSQYERERDEDKRGYEESSDKTQKHLVDKVAALERENKELTSKKFKAESAIEVLKSKVRQFGDDLGEARRSAADLLSKWKASERQMCDVEGVRRRLEVRVEELEKEREATGDTMSQIRVELDSTRTDKERCERILAERQQAYEEAKSKSCELREKVEEMNTELANVNVARKNLMIKLNIQKNITTNQDKFCCEQEEKLKQLQAKGDQLSDDNQVMKCNIHEKDEVISLLNEQLEQKCAQIRANQQVITWLHKQVEGSQPITTRPAIPQPNTTRPAIPQPNTTRPAIPQPNTTRPAIPQANTTRPAIPQPQPNTTRPAIPQPQPNTTRRPLLPLSSTNQRAPGDVKPTYSGKTVTTNSKPLHSTPIPGSYEPASHHTHQPSEDALHPRYLLPSTGARI